MASSAIDAIMAAPTPSQTPNPPEIACIHRTTKGNRSLWYQLTVLQQPERARACGSGSKGEDKTTHNMITILDFNTLCSQQ